MFGPFKFLLAKPNDFILFLCATSTDFTFVMPQIFRGIFFIKFYFKNYKIESVLLTRYVSLDKLIEQIDFTKPKTISCSYHFPKKDLLKIKKIFRRLKIGIAINPENFDKKYIESIRKIVDVIYFDMNVYRKKSIKKYSLRKSIKQIQFIKSKNIPVYIGGGIDKKNVSNILKQITPFGLDISRSLKNQRNLISKSKLKDFLNQISVG